MVATFFEMKHSKGPLPASLNGTQFKYLEMDKITFRCCHPNNTAILIDGEIVVIDNIIKTNDSGYIAEKYFTDKGDFYNTPFESSKLQIFKARQLTTESYYWPVSSIMCKAFDLTIPASDCRAIFPICIV